MEIMSDIRNKRFKHRKMIEAEENLYDAYKLESKNKDLRICHARQKRNRSS